MAALCLSISQFKLVRVRIVMNPCKYSLIRLHRSSAIARISTRPIHIEPLFGDLSRKLVRAIK